LPAWCSWKFGLELKISHNFFDERNCNRFLPNWKAVGNPHIPAEGSTLSHAQASDILLIVGSAYHAVCECAEADPDSPLVHIPIEIDDLRLVTSLPTKSNRCGKHIAVGRLVEFGTRQRAEPGV
jgi:hypothetical protein